MPAAKQIFAGDKPLEVFGWPSPNFADFDGDGDLDLVLHFRIQEMVELNADYRDALAADLEDGVIDDNHQSIKVTLRGETTDGISIEGSDTIDAFFAGKKFRDFVDSLE